MLTWRADGDVSLIRLKYRIGALLWLPEDHNLKRRLLNSSFALLPHIIFILTVTVSYRRIYLVLETNF